MAPKPTCMHVIIDHVCAFLSKAEFLKSVAEKKDLQETMQAIANVAATVLDSGDLR